MLETELQIRIPKEAIEIERIKLNFERETHTPDQLQARTETLDIVEQLFTQTTNEIFKA